MEQLAQRPAPARAARWDWEAVEAALLRAIDTLRRMPMGGPGAGGICWPAYPRDAWFAYDPKDPPPLRPALPSPDEISQVDEVLGWLALIPDARDRRVVQWHIRGHGWRKIMRHDGRTAPTLRKRYRDGLDTIAAQLNRRGTKVF